MSIELKAQGVCAEALDVGAGGADKSAIATRVGPVCKVREYEDDNGISLTGTAFDVGMKEQISYFHYDAPGVGFAVKSAIQSSERKIPFICYGLWPSGAVSDSFYKEFDDKAKNIFVNARAEWWWLFARRLEKTWEHVNGVHVYDEEELVSLPENGNLKAELCSPLKMTTESGKKKVESKKDMKKRGIASGNMADAVVMCFVPRDSGHKHVVNERPILRCVEQIEMNWGVRTAHRMLHYGAISQSTDIEVNILCAVWDQHDAILYIYDEIKEEMPIATKLVPDIVKRMNLRTVTLTRLMGNREILDEDKRTLAKEMNRELFQIMRDHQSVKIKPPRRYDILGAVAILNELIAGGRFKIASPCKQLVDSLLNWTIEGDKVKAYGMRECLLMIVSELIKVVDIKEVLKHVEYHTFVTGKKAEDVRVVPGKGYLGV